MSQATKRRGRKDEPQRKEGEKIDEKLSKKTFFT
jgi:hypothetical protein